MASVTTSLHTTLVTKISEYTLDALATTTSFTVSDDIPTYSPKANRTITETLVHIVITTLIPHPTTTSGTGASSLPSPFTSSQNGAISPDPHRFPTALVAILLSLFSLAILIVLLIYLRRRGHFSTFPSLSLSRSPENNYVWSAYGLVRASSLERSKKRHRLRDLQKAEHEDPIAVAIRKEEQERRKKEMEERGGASRFYAPQVRHLVQLMGSKEEIRIDVRNQLKRAKSWRWGKGKGMGENEMQSNSAPSAGL